jgi:hypothetical protein
MKKRILFIWASGILAVGLLFGVTRTVFAYSGDTDTALANGGGNGNGYGSKGDLTDSGCYGVLCLNYADDAAVGTLTAEEQNGLLFMVEEEKMARDVYQVLAAKWNLAIFTNIAQSEQSHMDALSNVIASAGLTNPVTATAGTFTNHDLQALYNELTANGGLSLTDALLVGGLVEETDIRDLQAYLSATTNSQLTQVYNNLLSGSFNHLQAFANEYALQSGTAYTAQVLDSTTFQMAIASPTGSAGNLGAAMGMGSGRHGR